MEALSTSSSYISNPLPKTKHLFKPSLLPLVASSQSSCWLCNSPPKLRIPKLRIRDGSSHGLRIHSLLHNEGEGEDNLGESNGFGFFPGDIFSISQVLFFLWILKKLNTLLQFLSWLWGILCIGYSLSLVLWLLGVLSCKVQYFLITKKKKSSILYYRSCHGYSFLCIG